QLKAAIDEHPKDPVWPVAALLRSPLQGVLKLRIFKMFHAQGDGFLGHHQTNPIGQTSREQAPDLLQTELTQSQEESQSALKEAKEQRLLHQPRSLSRSNRKGSMLNNLRGHLNLQRWNHRGEQGNQQQHGDIPGLSVPEKPQETSPEREGLTRLLREAREARKGRKYPLDDVLHGFHHHNPFRCLILREPRSVHKTFLQAARSASS